MKTTRELVPIDRLTPEEMAGSYQVESLDRTEREINYLKDKMRTISKATLVVAFELGRRLVGVKAALDHGQFLPWLEQNFLFSQRTARHYMKLYERFQGEPAALLENLDVHDAYVLAGVKKAAAEESGDEDGEGKLEFAGKRDLAAERARMVEIFKNPTVSGKELKNHRVENVRGQIYVYRKDVGIVAPAMDLYLGKPVGLPEPDWIEMQEAFVIATELYLAKIEAYEEAGRIAPPEDSRILTVVEKTEERKKRRPYGKD